jgi:hypothetical protein
MTKTGLLIFAFLGFSLAAGAKDKSYTVTLNEPVQFGASRLQPGKYKLELEGNRAILTSKRNHRSVTAPVTVKQANRKFDNTGVELNTTGRIDRLEGVELGGTHMNVHFD